MASVTGNVVLTAWYSYLNYTIADRQDDVLISYTAGMIVKSGEKTNRKFTSTISATGMASQSGTLAAKSRSAGTYPIKTGSFTIPKGLNDSSRTITHSCVGTSTNSYTSTCKITFTVKRNKIVVKYDLNGGEIRNTEDDYSEKNYFVYEDIPIVSYIPQNPGYKFIGWSENNILVESETVSPRTTDLILTATWEKIDLGEINYRSYRYTDWDYDNETTPAESAGQNGFSFVQIEKIGNGELSNSIKNITITIEQNNVLLNTEFDEVDLWYSTMKNIDLTKSYDFSKKIYIESEYWDGEYLYTELNDKISEEIYVWDAYKQGSQMSMGIGIKASEENLPNNGRLDIAMDTYFYGKMGNIGTSLHIKGKSENATTLTLSSTVGGTRPLDGNRYEINPYGTTANYEEVFDLDAHGVITTKEAGIYLVNAHFYFTDNYTVNDILHGYVGINTSTNLGWNEVIYRTPVSNPWHGVGVSFVYPLPKGIPLTMMMHNQEGARGRTTVNGNVSLMVTKIGNLPNDSDILAYNQEGWV